MLPLRRVLSLLVCFLSSGVVKAEELPPRAIARLGNYRFYHGPGIRCAVLSPDGSRVASAARYPSDFAHVTDKERDAYDRGVILWDAATGERVHEFQVPHAPVCCLAFSPDGKRLAAACGTGTDNSGVTVFTVATGKLLLHLGHFTWSPVRLQFSADGKQLHVSEWHGPVSAWDAGTGKRLRFWEPPEGVKFSESAKVGVLSPDGKFIAWEMQQITAFLRERGNIRETLSLRIHHADTDKLLYRKEFTKPFNSVAFSPDGKRFVVHRGTFTIWETATGKELYALDASQPYQAALTPDWRHAVFDDGWSRVCFWDLTRGKKMRELYPGFLYITFHLLESQQIFSADGQTLMLATDSTLRLFDLGAGKERAVPGHRSWITPRFSNDGRTLFTSCREAKRSWDVSSGKEPTLLSHEQRKVWEGLCRNQVIAHSADGRLLVDTPDDIACVRETATGRVLGELEGKPRSVVFGLFAPNAMRVLLQQRLDGKKERFLLYDVRTGKVAGEINPAENVGRPVFSPDGRLLAWTDHANAIHLHDAITGKAIRTLRSSHPLPLPECTDAFLLFSPDSEYLLVSTYMDELGSKLRADEKRNTLPARLFHVSRDRETNRFYTNSERTTRAAHLTCVAWSPDGRLLAVAEKHCGTIRLLEVASGKVRTEFRGHRHGVHGLAFSPDGKVLASGGEDNVAYLWDVTGAQTAAAGNKASEADLAKGWSDLAAEDGKRAGEAIAAFLRTPGPSMAFLAERLRPVEGIDQKRLTRLIADLDDDDFARREAASRVLAQFGERAEAGLRRALQDGPPREAKRRLEELLHALELRTLPAETLRILRAIEVLEHLGTPAARRCLEELAAGVPAARQTSDAKAALQRLARKAP